MSPTAEWYAADADDSDRSVTDDVTANAHETARAAMETGETGARVHGHADLLRKRTAALDRVAAENERLRGEVERLTEHKAEWRDAACTNKRQWRDALARAEAAEAKLRDVEALLDSWTTGIKVDLTMGTPKADVEPLERLIGHLRAVLARSQAPQAPAEQDRCPTCGKARDDLTPGPHAEGWGVCPESFHFRAPSAPPATADDEEVRRG